MSRHQADLTWFFWNYGGDGQNKYILMHVLYDVWMLMSARVGNGESVSQKYIF